MTRQAITITVDEGFSVMAYEVHVPSMELKLLRGADVQDGEDAGEIVDAILETVRERLLAALN